MKVLAVAIAVVKFNHLEGLTSQDVIFFAG
jgi:hypothetical protein